MKKILWMAEGMGLYTKGFSNKEDAVKAMREDAQKEHDLDPAGWGDFYRFSPSQITSETVEATVYRKHEQCGTETIGDDNVCFECGETCGTNGRPTFAFIFNPS